VNRKRKQKLIRRWVLAAAFAAFFIAAFLRIRSDLARPIPAAFFGADQSVAGAAPSSASGAPKGK
jgi:hypothetical protein